MQSKYLRASQGSDGPELWITGEIGVDTVAVDVVRAIQFYNEQGVTPILNLYSHGGMVDDANAFYGYVEKAGLKAKVRILGTAMSAAVTYAAAFGRENSEIHPTATVMIHQSSGGTDEMREAGDNSMVAIYRKLTGMPERKLREMMAATTTMTAHEAVQMGFVGKVMKSELRLAAMYDAQPFNETESKPKMKVKAKLTGTIDTVKALVTGQEVEVEIDANAELEAANNALAQATSDRQAAEAKAKEATDAEAAAQAKIAELTKAKEEAEAAKAAAETTATEVTAKFNAADVEIVKLKARVAELEKLPTVKATAVSGAEAVQVPTAETEEKVAPHVQALRAALRGTKPAKK